MIDLYSIANSAIAWAIRYLVVSTPVLILLLAATRIFPRLPHRFLDYMWKGALLGSFVITTLLAIEFQRPAVATFEVPLPAPAPVTVKTDVPVATGTEESVKQPPDFIDVLTPARHLHWPSIITTLWLGGALIGLGLLATRHILLYHRIGKRVPVMDERVRKIITRLSRKAGIARSLYVSSSQDLFSPIAIGSSQICLPERAIRQANDDEFEGMIAHELAHLVRHDPFWLMSWNISISILFFQPLLILARRRFQASAEYLCDSWAIRHTRRPDALVRCLVSVAEGFKTGAEHRLAVGMASSKRTLLDRARAALEGRHDHLRSKTMLWAALAIATFFGAALVAPAINFGAIEPVKQKDSLQEVAMGSNLPDQNEITEGEGIGSNIAGKEAPKSHSFIIRFNDLLRFLIEPGNELMPNPRPGETARGSWRGNHHEINAELSYRAEIRGVVLTDDEQRIHRIERGGYLKFRIEADGRTYILEVVPEGNKLIRRFWINNARTDLKPVHRTELLALLDKAREIIRPAETRPEKPTRPTRETRPTKSVDRIGRPPKPSVFYSTGNSQDTFVVYYNELLRYLFDPANDRQPNPLPEKSSGGKWGGGLSESQDSWNYRVRFKDVVLTDDNTRIHRIGPKGYFRFTISIESHTYKLEMTPTGDGELQRRYWRDREEETLLLEDQRKLLDILDRLVAFSIEKDRKEAGSGSSSRNR